MRPPPRDINALAFESKARKRMVIRWGHFAPHRVQHRSLTWELSTLNAVSLKTPPEWDHGWLTITAWTYEL